MPCLRSVCCITLQHVSAIPSLPLLPSMHSACSVIYTMSRERTVTWRFVTFKLLLDAWQLLMLIQCTRAVLL